MIRTFKTKTIEVSVVDKNPNENVYLEDILLMADFVGNVSNRHISIDADGDNISVDGQKYITPRQALNMLNIMMYIELLSKKYNLNK